MTGKQLKNSILQWAIQGKLVPQDPNDEPASVLLEKIRAEKERLIKEGKIKRDKKESIIYRGEDNSYYEKFLATGEVKCIDEEIPFEVPKGWEWCRLESIVSVLGDGIHGTPEYCVEGNVFFINGNNLVNGKIVIKPDTKRLNDVEAKKYRKELNDRSVLVSINGTIGNIAFYNEENVILGKSACYFNLLGFIRKPYIKVILETDYFLSYAKQVATGSTIKNVPLTGMKSLLIPMPPYQEQDRIIKCLNDLEPHLLRFSRSQIKLDTLNKCIKYKIRKSILQEAIQGRLVPQDSNDEPASVLLEKIQAEKERLVKEGILKKKDLVSSTIYKGDDNKYFEKKGKENICIDDEIPFELPRTWEWKRLADIALVYTGNSISETEKELKYQDAIGRDYIGTKDVGFDNSITYNNGVAIPSKYEEEFRIAPKDSVLMCIEGGSAGRKIAILNRDVCFGNKLCCFSPFNIVLSKYLFYYLQSPSFYDIFNDNKTGIIGGVSIANVKKLLIPVPPKAEIIRIVNKVEVVVASIMSRLAKQLQK